MILDEFVVLIKTEISRNFNKGQHNEKKRRHIVELYMFRGCGGRGILSAEEASS